MPGQVGSFSGGRARSLFEKDVNAHVPLTVRSIPTEYLPSSLAGTLPRYLPPTYLWELGTESEEEISMPLHVGVGVIFFTMRLSDPTYPSSIPITKSFSTLG